jgi:hypothetical protein
MRSTILVVLLTSAAWGQSMLEHAAAAGGGTVGGVAGKKVSDGITSIFGKVDKQTQKAANSTPARSSAASPAASPAAPSPNGNAAPLFEVGPGAPKQRISVPPPPPLRHAQKAAPVPVTRVISVPMVIPQVQQRDPDPVPIAVTPQELRSVSHGMSRSEVLKLGVPTARVLMFDDGHLIEIFRYQDHDNMLGVVRLTDGSVDSILVR